MKPPLPCIAFLDGLGGSEIILIMVVVLIFFGGEKLPEFARGLGKAIREFKKAAGDVEHEFKRAMDEIPEKPVASLIKPVANTPAATPGPAASALPAPPAKTPEPPADHGIDA